MNISSRAKGIKEVDVTFTAKFQSYWILLSLYFFHNGVNTCNTYLHVFQMSRMII